MRRLRKAIGIFAAGAFGFVLLILLAFAAVQTQTAREWIAAQATRALSGDGATAFVGGIEGTIPFDMRLSEIHLGDADGEFLAATNLAFALAPRGLLLDRALGRADHLPLAVSLKGAGPLADWRGSFFAAAGDLARLDAALVIAGTNEHHFGMQGTLAALPLLPPALTPVLGEKVKFEAQLHDTGEGSVVIERLTLDAAAGRFTASGHYDDSQKKFAADATLAAVDLAPLSGLAGLTLAGAGQVQLTASGTTERPQADLIVEGTALHAGDDRGDRVRGQ